MTYGTRGDVEPFIALAIGLRDQGFAVTIATAERYSDWISEFDIDVAPLSNGSIDRFNEPDMRKLVERNSNFFERRAAYLRLRKKSKLITAELIADCIRVIKHTAPDLIVFHPELRYAPHIAEATSTPIVMAILQPSFVPTREFPPSLVTASADSGVESIGLSLLGLFVLAFVEADKHVSDITAEPGQGILRQGRFASTRRRPYSDDARI